MSKEKSDFEVQSSSANSSAASDQLRVSRLGDMSMTIDPVAGARIVSFVLGETELLTPASVHPDNYGSTFWDSPQINWNWPPRAVLDSLPYSVGSTDAALSFESGIDPSGLQFSKTIRPDPLRNCFEIDYRMANRSDKPVKAGPWEVTRVAGGLSFFPYEEVEGIPPTALEPVSYQDGICWYAFDATFLAAGRKLFSGAREGWLAHVGPDRTLFVKTFPDTCPDDYAPEQAEVEIWGHDGGIYVELENHGQYRELAPGETISYPVRWYLLRLPAEIDVRPGSAALVDLVRKLVC